MIQCIADQIKNLAMGQKVDNSMELSLDMTKALVVSYKSFFLLLK